MIGTSLALATMHAVCNGNWTTLLRVGSDNPLRWKIEREVGPVQTAGPLGHDGQLYYLIARDPFGSTLTPDVISSLYRDRSTYRYRRILFPLLSGGGGQFSGRWTLLGMIVCAAAGIGLATVAIADLAFQWRVTGPRVVIAMANIGAVLSAALLTVDALALGLSLAGLTLTLRRRHSEALFALAAAALTKETHILMAASLAVWLWLTSQRQAALTYATVPVLPVALWSGWLWVSFPRSAAGLENFHAPLVGVLRSGALWLTEEHPSQAIFAILALLSVGLAIEAVLRRRDGLVRCLLIPWIALALCSSAVVWRKPNNSLRAFAIVWPLAILMRTANLRQTRPVSDPRANSPHASP